MNIKTQVTERFGRQGCKGRVLEIVDSKSTLRYMAKKGLIEWPVRMDNENVLHENFTYVRPLKGMEFEYAGDKYRIKYLDGAFYPYVYKVVKES